ncbi:MAG: hypothetical protein ACTSSH_00115 [Candidatus Heimdallarchaeota archaeon]
MFNKKIMKEEFLVSKSFKYSLGNISLEFQLRNDTKEDMQDFLQCLKKATEGVQEELNKLK